VNSSGYWALTVQAKRRQTGITAIWTIHYMFEPERLCDRVAIVNHSRLLINDTPDRVRGG